MSGLFRKFLGEPQPSNEDIMYGAQPDMEERLARKRRLEERKERFQDLSDRVAEIPSMAVEVPHGHMAHAAIYEPAKFPDGKVCGYAVCIHVSCFSSKEVPFDFERLIDYDRDVWSLLASKIKRVKGREGDWLQLKSNKWRPEVYAVGQFTEGATFRPDDHPELLDRLVRALNRLDARNLPRNRLFENHACVVHMRPYAYWSGDARVEFDRTGVGMAIERVGVRV